MRLQLYLDRGAAFGIISFSKMGNIHTVMNIFLLVQSWTNWTLDISLRLALYAEKWGWKKTWENRVVLTVAPFMLSASPTKRDFSHRIEIEPKEKEKRFDTVDTLTGFS